MIVEIAFDLPDGKYEESMKAIEAALETCSDHWRGYYIEPASCYYSLEELEADCEGK